MAVNMTSKMPTRPALTSLCSSCRHRFLRQQTRLASTDSNNPSSGLFNTPTRKPPPSGSIADRLDASRPPPRRPSNIFKPANPLAPSPSQIQSPSSTSRTAQSEIAALLESVNAEALTRPNAGVSPDEPYHLNVMATKHNTHITFTGPSRDTILSFACGNIGLRKAQRGTFDAAYQLATFAMRKMAMHQWRSGGKKMVKNEMKTLRNVGTKDSGVGIEVVLRGYGAGREAFQKALLGTEGQMIKPMVVRVTDATRLKFGGTRSPAVRRL